MDDRDAWLEDVKRWYFDERKAEAEPPRAVHREEGPSLVTRQRPTTSSERPDAH